MPRNMSFALTTAQYNDRTKTETMRLGWAFLKPGEVFMGIKQGQGLKKGEAEFVEFFWRHNAHHQRARAAQRSHKHCTNRAPLHGVVRRRIERKVNSETGLLCCRISFYG